MGKKYEIGGFPSMEHYHGNEYHEGALALNTARNAMEYVLSQRKFKKVWLPSWSCDCMLEPCIKLDIPYEYYAVDKHMEPIVEPKLVGDDCIIIINYFGLLTGKIPSFDKIYKNIIVDNTQAFFSKALQDVDTVYSLRKFFGVTDGAYLISNLEENVGLQDFSYERNYCIKRLEVGANLAYRDFCMNEKELEYQPIKKMSEYTKNILKSINYDRVHQIRTKNFARLHSLLKGSNQLDIGAFEGAEKSFVYPYYNPLEGLREKLIDVGIYIPMYWKETLSRVGKDSCEAEFTKYVLPLPIDQRYGEMEMQIIADEINQYLNR